MSDYMHATYAFGEKGEERELRVTDSWDAPSVEDELTNDMRASVSMRGNGASNYWMNFPGVNRHEWMFGYAKTAVDCADIDDGTKDELLRRVDSEVDLWKVLDNLGEVEGAVYIPVSEVWVPSDAGQQGSPVLRTGENRWGEEDGILSVDYGPESEYGASDKEEAEELACNFLAEISGYVATRFLDVAEYRRSESGEWVFDSTVVSAAGSSEGTIKGVEVALTAACDAVGVAFDSDSVKYPE